MAMQRSPSSCTFNTTYGTFSSLNINLNFDFFLDFNGSVVGGGVLSWPKIFPLHRCVVNFVHGQ